MTAERIVLPEVTLSKFWLRQSLKGGGAFEEPDEAEFVWELVSLPAGCRQFHEMDRRFWPLREEFYPPEDFAKNEE